MGKGKLPAAVCALLLLVLTGAGGLPPGEAPIPAVSAAVSGTWETGGRYLALDARDAEDGESSTPFGELPDMQKLTEAMEIIGDTPLDELSDAQLQQLEDAGVDLETLKDNESLLEGVRDTLPEENGFPWPLVAGAVTVGAAGCAVAAILIHRRRKRPK